MEFFIGLHEVAHAKFFERSFISINRIKKRKALVGAKQWIMDSGAFSEISRHGCYRSTVEDYAAIINHWAEKDPGLIAAVAQDYMCEPWILSKTGLTIKDHQRLTIERYDQLLPLVKTYLMPVLQGYTLSDYLDHIDQYGNRLAKGAWVGIGSLCKRNSNVEVIEMILTFIKKKRPDLRLHGFGLKFTALKSAVVRDKLASADSMAWSYNAWRNGRDRHSRDEAEKWLHRLEFETSKLGIANKFRLFAGI